MSHDQAIHLTTNTPYTVPSFSKCLWFSWPPKTVLLTSSCRVCQYKYILQYNQYIKLQIYKHFTFINLFKDLASYSWEIQTVFSGNWSCPNSRTRSARNLGLVVDEDQSNEFPDPIELVFNFELVFDFELFEGVVVIELAFVFELFQGVVVFEFVIDFQPLLRTLQRRGCL